MRGSHRETLLVSGRGTLPAGQRRDNHELECSAGGRFRQPKMIAAIRMLFRRRRANIPIRDYLASVLPGRHCPISRSQLADPADWTIGRSRQAEAR